MAKVARPEHAKLIEIEILNIRDYVGETRGQLFIKQPVRFLVEADFDLPGDLYKFFFRLVYLAARQSTPGVLRTSAVRLSKECRCHPESALSYLPRLIERQLIREVNASELDRIEEKREEERRRERSSSLFASQKENQEFAERFAAIPQEWANALELPGWQDAVVKASLEKHPFLTQPMIDMFYAEYPGEKSGSVEFALKYWKLVIHSEKALWAMDHAIRHYRNSRDSNFSTLKGFLKSDWWSYLYDKDPMTGGPRFPKTFGPSRGLELALGERRIRYNGLHAPGSESPESAQGESVLPPDEFKAQKRKIWGISI